MKKYLFPLIALSLLAQVAQANFYPTGGSTYTLQSSVSSTATTLTLSSFKEPVSLIPYTMSYLNSSIECATIDPQTSHSEFVSFTGITQNANGTATISGLARGLGRSYPYTASTTLASAHSGQSQFILSDSPCLFILYAVKGNNEIIPGSWTFSSPGLAINIASTSWLGIEGSLFAYASSTNQATILGLNAGGNLATTSATQTNMTAIGYASLAKNTTGGQNVAVGRSSLARNTTGNDNTAIGDEVLQTNGTGSQNTAVGSNAMTTTTGTGNTALGYIVLQNVQNGGENTAIGSKSGPSVSRGGGNMFFGVNNTVNGGNITTGNNNLAIGYNSVFPSATANSQLNIGNYLFGTLAATSTANTAILPITGMFSVGSTSPFSKFSVAANNGDTLVNLLTVGSSTASATTTLFNIDNTGNASLPSLTATSTIANALTVAKYFAVGTTAPPYGVIVPQDTIDAGGYANDFFAINSYNGGVGPCAQSGFMADGNNPALSSYYGSIMETNTGYTGVGCGVSPLTSVNPFDLSIFNPSGGIDFAVGSTTANSAFRFIAGATGSTELARITNLGLMGIGTSTPVANFQVTASTTNATTTMEVGKMSQTSGTCLKMYNDAGTAEYVTIHNATLTVSATTCKSGF